MLSKNGRKSIRVIVLAFAFVGMFMVSSTLSAASDSLTLLYFNDGHELSPVVDELGERGGVGRLKTVIDGQRKIDPNAVVLFGGDLAGGTLFGGVFKGEPMVEAFNMLSLDFASFGQHDFDFGYEHAMKLVKKSKFQWISTNLRYLDGYRWKTPENTKPYAIVERNGYKVGIVGLTDAMDTSTREGIVKQEDLLRTGASCSRILKKLGCFPIVAITQTDLATNIKLINEAPFFNVVLTEERFENQTAIHYVGKVPVVSPCGNLGSVVRVKFNKAKDTLVSVFPVTADIKGDKSMVAFEKKYEKLIAANLSDVAGRITGSSSLHSSRIKESNSGDLISDAFRSYFESDLAFMHGGGIRAALKSGSFTAKEAKALLPFNNTVNLVVVKGSVIRKAIEHGLKDYLSLDGNFLQISGGTYTYDDRLRAGKKVVSVTVAGRPLVNKRMYKVAIPSYLVSGGSGFEFEGSSVSSAKDDKPVDSEVLFQYVKGQKKIKLQNEKRIIRIVPGK